MKAVVRKTTNVHKEHEENRIKIQRKKKQQLVSGNLVSRNTWGWQEWRKEGSANTRPIHHHHPPANDSNITFRFNEIQLLRPLIQQSCEPQRETGKRTRPDKQDPQYHHNTVSSARYGGSASPEPSPECSYFPIFSFSQFRQKMSPPRQMKSHVYQYTVVNFTHMHPSLHVINPVNGASRTKKMRRVP